MVSTKDLQKARQNAKRKRTFVACARCKRTKTKCSDYRPCNKCKKSGADCTNSDDVRIPEYHASDFSASTSPIIPTINRGGEVPTGITNGHDSWNAWSHVDTYLQHRMFNIQASEPQPNLRQMVQGHTFIPRDFTSNPLFAQSIRPAQHLMIQAQQLHTISQAQLLQPSRSSQQSTLPTSSFLPHAVSTLLSSAASVPPPLQHALRLNLALAMVAANVPFARPSPPHF
jgi:hypothetical protein